jgi:uncharacterized membrane protein YfcA
MNESHWIFFLICLLLISFLYASVGHGGASGYLALMALFGFSPDAMKPIALVLNIVVASLSFFHFYQQHDFPKKLFFWLIVASVPMAFIGGQMKLSDHLYKIILGLLLLIPTLRILIQSKQEEKEIKPYSIAATILMGAGIGWVSGMIGIGGGIILSPLLLVLGWASMKQTAAMSAAFIVLNSISGLLGNQQLASIQNDRLMLFIVFAVAGGWLGSWFGSKKYNNYTLRLILSIVLLMASCKLIWV